MKRIALSGALAAAVAVGLAVPVAGSAQGGPGFLFKRPSLSVGIRTGYTLPRGSSHLFEFSREEFTLNRFDFDAPYLGGEVALRIAERWDAALSLGWSESHGLSEYRDWVDQDNLPIEQETTFQTVSAALGARYYFKDRGRSIGRFAWVPSRLSPYVGAGFGVVSYEFAQVGDFVDFQTLDIVGDALSSTGSGAAVYGSAGADLSVGKQFYLTGEAKYTLASGGVKGDYSLYDWIDLSGLQLTAGISLRW
ncbi:MAG: hypothetical protein FJ207_09875 [Gemmatimonadetes bacterium]|nr:hypothetical protein [Gemmatimonadota bacterium]